MVAVNIKAFRGQIPRMSERLLQPNQATRALNCKITSGRLDPLAGLGLVFTSTLGRIRTAFRYQHASAGSLVEHWLAWPSDVNVVQSPLANDSLGRIYFSSEDFEPRMSTYDLAISGSTYPNAWYCLGVPAPASAAVLSATGGTTPTEARAYTYTFVNALGEESGPAPASNIVTANTNGSWSLAGMQTLLPNGGTVTAASVVSEGRVRATLSTTLGLFEHESITISGVVGMVQLNGSHRILSVSGSQVDLAIQGAQPYVSGGTWLRNAPHNTSGLKKRIYRSAGSGAAFLYVDEIDAAQATYGDTKPTGELGETLPTLNTLPPPKNLTGMISLPNGCLVGLSENELCFSDPYMPYSWPLGNRYAFSGRGVAAVAAGNSVIVLTDTSPIIFTGSDPEAMSPSVMETHAPCVSKRGVTDVGGGCLYPSLDGLWLAAPGRVENLTKRLYREEEWSRLNPYSFDSAYRDGQYYGHYTGAGGEKRIWVLDVGEPDSVVEVAEWCDAMVRNDYDGQLYLAQGGKLYLWDGNPGQAYESDWVGSAIQLPRPTNFAVAQVHAKFDDIRPVDTTQVSANEQLMLLGADAVAGHLNGQELLAFEVNASYIVPATPDKLKRVQFTLMADGKPIFTKAVQSSQPFRLPAGYRAEVFSVAISASVPTYSITIAESTAELAAAS
jgi:hypothetical protein